MRHGSRRACLTARPACPLGVTVALVMLCGACRAAPVAPLPETGPNDAATLSVAAAPARERDRGLTFIVTLSRPVEQAVTVDYATQDGTATAGSDYTNVSGTLTFSAGVTTRTVGVPVADDREHEGDETLTLVLSNPRAAAPATMSATGTIVDDDPPVVPPEVDLPEADPPGEGPATPAGGEAPELASLQVTGAAGGLSPAFDRTVKHYAVRCADGTRLTVTARSALSGARLTLLRTDPTENVSAVGTLTAQLTVGGSHDIVIRLGAGGRTATYIVHCIPPDLYHFRVLKRTAGASDGLLFLSVESGHGVVVDYNGVTRYHYQRPALAFGFRPHANGPRIDGRQVRYSGLSPSGVRLMDADFEEIRSVSHADLDAHDFVLGAHSYLFIRYVRNTHDASVWDDTLSPSLVVFDSVITEVPFDGADPVDRWNSWDHLKIAPDCPIATNRTYSWLNSLQLIDGDVIASFRRCDQIVRLDRSSGTWAMLWKLGGSDPPRSDATEYLEIVGDPFGGFCRQHQATLTTSQHVVLYDNRSACSGRPRVVEYDISSGTQATFVREFQRPAGHGDSLSKGGVTLLDDGNWLIAWGTTNGATVPSEEVAAVTEVDTSGSAVFHMNIISPEGRLSSLYRVYYDDADSVTIPMELP